MAVISKVKDVKSFARQFDMSDDLITEISSGPAADIVGKVSSYCLDSNLSWSQMKDHFKMSDEINAYEITATMEQYNREGTQYMLC